LALLSASRVVALMNNRNFVIPEDIKSIAISCLSHRIVLSYEAMADDITEQDLIKKILENINVV